MTDHEDTEHAGPGDPTTSRTLAPDPTVCPLCGGNNACALAAANGTSEPCWCERATIPRELIDQLPDGARGVCICARCVEDFATGRRPDAATMP